MRKHILILGHNYATQFIDIYNQYTQLFNQTQFEVTVAFLTGEQNQAVKKRMIAENIHFLNFPKKHIRTLKIHAIKKLLALCKEKKFQIVICHRYKPTYIMLWVAKFCHIPAMIFVMHELNTMISFGRQLTITLLDRKNMLYAGVSNAVRDDMRQDLKYIPQERILTLHNMIDVPATMQQLMSREAARSALKLSNDAFVFGHIARLAPNKDQATLIEAFASIKPYYPHIKLIIIGDGELEMRLKQQVIEYDLGENIIFTGFLSNANRFMRAFDCFILSSVQEAFGRVLLEAMIAECPIIATAVHGIPEVLGDTGILVKHKNVTELASAMKQILTLTQIEREAVGKKGYQRAIQHFSIPIFQQQFWQLPLIQAARISL